MAFPIAIGMAAFQQKISKPYFLMASVYILYSEKLGKYYIGNIQQRIEEHKNKKFPECFTSKENNWNLFFEVSDLEYKQARSIEKHIKAMKSSVYIINIKKYPEMLQKLKERYS